MATNTILQKLDGGSDFGATTSNRRQVETFITKETVVVGDWVAFDYDATADGDVTLGVYKADGNSSPVRTPVGVVLRGLDFDVNGNVDLSADKRIEVCISGVCDALVGDNGGAGHAATGVLLQITNTAGVADIASAGSAQPVCGILAEVVPAAAGNTLKRVVVRKSF